MVCCWLNHGRDLEKTYEESYQATIKNLTESGEMQTINIFEQVEFKELQEQRKKVAVGQAELNASELCASMYPSYLSFLATLLGMGFAILAIAISMQIGEIPLLLDSEFTNGDVISRLKEDINCAVMIVKYTSCLIFLAVIIASLYTVRKMNQLRYDMQNKTVTNIAQQNALNDIEHWFGNTL